MKLKTKANIAHALVMLSFMRWQESQEKDTQKRGVIGTKASQLEESIIAETKFLEFLRS